jgi:uncharacterized protein (DUF1501 family)
MLTLWGPGGGGRYCDGVSRRAFMQVGGLAMGGLSLPGLLQAQARGASPSSGSSSAGNHKSVIMIYLSGGIAHQDTVDPKPDAPEGVRGEFKPIATSVPGVFLSETMPRTAAIMDKVAVIRSLVGQLDEHSSFHCMTGFPMSVAQREGKPHFGSVISRVHGPVNSVVPPFVDLAPVMQHRPYNTPGAGMLLSPPKEVAPERFAGRRDLLGQFDAFRRSVDGAAVDGMGSCYKQAFDVLTSDALAKALDVERESPSLRARYGMGTSKPLGDAGPMWNDQFLVARRLVEAGARCVTLSYGFWDTHGDNFGHMRRVMPLFDQGVSALVEDLHQRGMDRDCTVVVWGEFGRTPKINATAGRDHWAPVNSAILAGGGMKVGQVIGSTDKLGGHAASRPVHYRDVLATVYHNLGVDPHTFLYDKANRPISILPPENEPIAELI